MHHNMLLSGWTNHIEITSVYVLHCVLPRSYRVSLSTLTE